MRISGWKVSLAAALWLVSAPALAASFSDTDFSRITHVVFEGESSKVNLVTSADGEPDLHIVRSGLRARSCRPSLDVRRVQSSLYLHLLFEKDATGVRRRCSVSLEGRLPPGLSVAIHQPAAVARIEGDYEDVSVAAANSHVSVDGTLRKFDLESANTIVIIDGIVGALHIDANRTVARLRLTDVSGTGTLRIHADNLVADVALPEGTILRPNIRAAISAFSSSVPFETDAELTLDIKSEILSGSVTAF